MKSRILNPPKRTRLLHGYLSKSQVVGMIELREAILEASRKTGKPVNQIMDEIIENFLFKDLSSSSSS